MLKILINQKVFIKNAGAMFSGAAVARGISFLAAPVIARLFSPEDFGNAALFTMLILLADPASTFLFENAAILEKDPEKSRGLSLLSLRLLILFSVLVFVLILILSVFQIHFSLLDNLGNSKYMLPPAILIYGLTKILNSWNVKGKKFKRIAFSEVSQVSSMVTSRISLGIILGSTVFGLVSGYIFGVAIKGTVLFKDVGFGNTAKIFDKGKLKLATIAREYKDFIFFASPLRLMNVISNNLPILLLAYLYSPAIVGFYALTNRLIRGPVNLFQKSLGQTYYQKASEIYNSGRSIRSSFMKTTIVLALIGIPACVIVMAIGEDIFTKLLGSEWRTAGRYIEILAPWFLTILLIAPANSVFVVVKKQKALFVTNVWGLLLKCFVFAIAYLLKFEAETTIFWFMIVSIVNEVAIMIQSYFFSKIKPAMI